MDKSGDRAVRIDGLQFCRWSNKIYRQMRRGGVDAVHATIAYHENNLDTLAKFTEWQRRFAANESLIFHGLSGDDVRRAKAEGRTAIFLGFQNPSPLEQNIQCVELWHTIGIRFMQLTYNYQSLLATGCLEREDGGVTRMGREAIGEMNRLGMAVDLSHAGPRSALQAIEFSSRPVAVTHANPYAWHPVPRNLPDATLEALSESGGMLGFSLYPAHLKGGSECTRAAFCQMVAGVAERFGTEFLGIGSDLVQGQPAPVLDWMRRGRFTLAPKFEEEFPAPPEWFRDNRDFPGLGTGLAEVGFNAAEIDGILGGNWLRFFDEVFSPAPERDRLASPRPPVTRLAEDRKEGGARFEVRPAAKVMYLARMGCAHPTRLSFARSLIRRLHRERAEVSRPVWEMDAEGYGQAVYTLTLGGGPLSLVALSRPLADEDRTDRVIAEAWDTAYALFDGVPGRDDLERLAANLPHQEAGRYRATELVLSRANKSERSFDHVVDSLAASRQPNPERIGDVGYLMRTTAVYGNGKFGVADRDRIAARSPLAGPFQAEFLTVWLIREFTHDLVEHIARARNPAGAVSLGAAARRLLGIGNATGLGMAPFLVNHPILIHKWAMARETALARVCAIKHASPQSLERFVALFARARQHVSDWNVGDARQLRRIQTLRAELAEVASWIEEGLLDPPAPWSRLMSHAADWSNECEEMLLSLVLEPHGELIDELEGEMASDVDRVWEPGMRLGELSRILARKFDWALDMDFDSPLAKHRFWYVSEEKLEPRLGLRFEEEGAERELPLDVARQAGALARDLADADSGASVAEFVMAHPEHRAIVQRVQTAERYPYAEIRENLIGDSCMPLDILRWKLAFFGATRFDPKSDRWTRVTLFQGAPTRATIGNADADDWAFAVRGEGR